MKTISKAIVKIEAFKFFFPVRDNGPDRRYKCRLICIYADTEIFLIK